jgi:hypothetical protein
VDVGWPAQLRNGFFALDGRSNGGGDGGRF